ncbi:MAG: hypothetical protein WKF78_04840 [Candidatus Limnocylindrales bacterium]
MDTGGALTGQRMTFGSAVAAAPQSWDLPPESFASGPIGGTILVGADDGATSDLRLLTAGAACAWDLAQEGSVVRRATLSPEGTSLYEARVDRRTRADLGVWRRTFQAADPPIRVMEPLAADARFGRTFTTELAWSPDGRTLAVQSCGADACRVRTLEPTTGRRRAIANPSLGTMVGLTADRLIVRGSCHGLPCPLLGVRLDDGAVSVLEAAAGQATLVASDGGVDTVVYEADARGTSLRSIAADGSVRVDLGSPPTGQRLVPLAPGMAAAAEIAAGSILLGPLDAALFTVDRLTVVQRLVDGRITTTSEGSR